jgi:hypothetical protein
MKALDPFHGAPPPESVVPEASGRLLALLGAQLGVALVDRVWVFPPLVRGRKEWGLVAVSRLTDDPGRRELVTGRYSAELTGGGVVFRPEVSSEGEAPPERLPRIMDGVVRRSGLHLGLPREVEIGGDSNRFESLVLALGPEPGPGDHRLSRIPGPSGTPGAFGGPS